MTYEGQGSVEALDNVFISLWKGFWRQFFQLWPILLLLWSGILAFHSHWTEATYTLLLSIQFMVFDHWRKTW